jgi:hypothetical protein
MDMWGTRSLLASILHAVVSVGTIATRIEANQKRMEKTLSANSDALAALVATGRHIAMFILRAPSTGERHARR